MNQRRVGLFALTAATMALAASTGVTLADLETPPPPRGPSRREEGMRPYVPPPPYKPPPSPCKAGDADTCATLGALDCPIHGKRNAKLARRAARARSAQR